MDSYALSKLSRKELQLLAQREGIKANCKSTDIVERLVNKYPSGVPKLEVQEAKTVALKKKALPRRNTRAHKQIKQEDSVEEKPLPESAADPGPSNHDIVEPRQGAADEGGDVAARALQLSQSSDRQLVKVSNGPRARVPSRSPKALAASTVYFDPTPAPPTRESPLAFAPFPIPAAAPVPAPVTDVPRPERQETRQSIEGGEASSVRERAEEVAQRTRTPSRTPTAAIVGVPTPAHASALSPVPAPVAIPAPESTVARVEKQETCQTINNEVAGSGIGGAGSASRAATPAEQACPPTPAAAAGGAPAVITMGAVRSLLAKTTKYVNTGPMFTQKVDELQFIERGVELRLGMIESDLEEHQALRWAMEKYLGAWKDNRTLWDESNTRGRSESPEVPLPPSQPSSPRLPNEDDDMHVDNQEGEDMADKDMLQYPPGDDEDQPEDSPSARKVGNLIPAAFTSSPEIPMRPNYQYSQASSSSGILGRRRWAPDDDSDDEESGQRRVRARSS